MNLSLREHAVPVSSVEHRLEPGTVHVWKIDLDAVSIDSDQPVVLCDEELERERQFHFPVHRRRFKAGRSSLRKILGGYTGAPPAQLQFRYGHQGKPELEGERSVHFNVSHSDNLALCAIAAFAQVGVDVERVREDVAFMEIAQSFFTQDEVRMLEMRPPSERAGTFFSVWTRKEAYIKAAGGGLSIPLTSFDVSSTLGRSVSVLEGTRLDQTSLQGGLWTMSELPIAEPYRGALVTASSRCKVRMYDWPTSD